MQLIFSTGNADKFETAHRVMKLAGITLVQAALDIPEIQSDAGAVIAADKAAKAYAILQQPVVVSDDTWEFPGLNGFPGPYMKYVNGWFTADDFVRLTAPLTDRRVVLINHLAYTDGRQTKSFTYRRHGTLLPEARGKSRHISHEIIAMEGDQGLSQAEATARGIYHSNTERVVVWQRLADWLKERPA